MGEGICQTCAEPDEGEQYFAAQQKLALQLNVVSIELGMPGDLNAVPVYRKGRCAYAGVCVVVHAQHGRGKPGVPKQFSGHTTKLLPHMTVKLLNLHC